MKHHHPPISNDLQTKPQRIRNESILQKKYTNFNTVLGQYKYL